jgi:hypothetical protein
VIAFSLEPLVLYSRNCMNYNFTHVYRFFIINTLVLLQIIYLFMIRTANLIFAAAMVNITLGQRPRGFVKENVS